MKAPSLVVLFWVLERVTTVVVALRICAGRLKVDDATMVHDDCLGRSTVVYPACSTSNPCGSHPSCFVLLQALTIIASTLFTIAVHYGYGQDIGGFSFKSAVHIFKFYTIA